MKIIGKKSGSVSVSGTHDKNDVTKPVKKIGKSNKTESSVPLTKKGTLTTGRHASLTTLWNGNKGHGKAPTEKDMTKPKVTKY